MGCGCGGGPGKPLMDAVAQRGGNSGLYSLITFPDCTDPYRGQYTGTAIFVVAPGSTDNERLFAWKDYEAATAYAEAIGYSQMDSVPTSSLCQQAVESVYG